MSIERWIDRLPFQLMVRWFGMLAFGFAIAVFDLLDRVFGHSAMLFSAIASCTISLTLAYPVLLIATSDRFKTRLFASWRGWVLIALFVPVIATILAAAWVGFHSQ